MDNYLKHLYHRLNQMPAGIQGVAWFISIKLSLFILQGAENVPSHLLTIFLQFILSMILLIIGVAFFDFILSRNDYQH
ncbi:hypothetical protein AALA52_04730 [Lactococcus ileimucosae]|uniref:Uncharacterized protein n=1 Tax=Lactococcus ileimucosae TaxID=2941329 RepID=A0ABV4D3H0_9LACT